VLYYNQREGRKTQTNRKGKKKMMYVMNSNQYDKYVSMLEYLQETYFGDDDLLKKLEDILENVAIED
jgi:hypothetical protein